MRLLQNFVALLLSLYTLLNGGCIREDMGDCDQTTAVTIKVVDSDDNDITVSGIVDTAAVYRYGPDRIYRGRSDFDREHITGRIPLQVNGEYEAANIFAGWGNLHGGQEVTAGNTPENSSVTLRREGSYFRPPDDLFFGFENTSTRAVYIENEVVLKMKVARLNITVRGLAEGEEYYFLTDLANTGYDFTGEPLAVPGTIMSEGAFNTAGDYVTPEPFNIIHTGSSGPNRGNLKVRFYRKTPGGTDELYAEAAADSEGNPVFPSADSTVNVLIVLGETDVTVQIVVTPWEQIYQWVDWQPYSVRP